MVREGEQCGVSNQNKNTMPLAWESTSDVWCGAEHAGRQSGRVAQAGEDISVWVRGGVSNQIMLCHYLERDGRVGGWQTAETL